VTIGSQPEDGKGQTHPDSISWGRPEKRPSNWIYHRFIGPGSRGFGARVSPTNDAKKTARSRFLARLTEMCAKRAIEVCPCAEDGKHAIYLLTLRPGADPGDFSA